MATPAAVTEPAPQASQAPAPPAAHAAEQGAGRPVVDLKTWLLIGAILLLGIVNQMYGIDIARFATRDAHQGAQLVGWMAGVCAALEIPVMLLAGRFADRFGRMGVTPLSGLACPASARLTDGMTSIPLHSRTTASPGRPGQSACRPASSQIQQMRRFSAHRSGPSEESSPVMLSPVLPINRRQVAIRTARRSRKSCSLSAMSYIGLVAVSSRSAGLSAAPPRRRRRPPPFPSREDEARPLPSRPR